MDLPPFLTVADFALRLNVAKNTIRNWIARGMPVVRKGRVVRVPVAEADLWLAKTDRAARVDRVAREHRVPIRKGTGQ